MLIYVHFKHLSISLGKRDKSKRTLISCRAAAGVESYSITGEWESGCLREHVQAEGERGERREWAGLVEGRGRDTRAFRRIRRRHFLCLECQEFGQLLLRKQKKSKQRPQELKITILKASRKDLNTGQRFALWLVPSDLRKPRVRVSTGPQTACHPLSYAFDTDFNLFLKRLCFNLEMTVFCTSSKSALTSAPQLQTTQVDGLRSVSTVRGGRPRLYLCHPLVTAPKHRGSRDVRPLALTSAPLRKVAMEEDEVVSHSKAALPVSVILYCRCLCALCTSLGSSD